MLAVLAALGLTLALTLGVETEVTAAGNNNLFGLVLEGNTGSADLELCLNLGNLENHSVDGDLRRLNNFAGDRTDRELNIVPFSLLC